MPRFEPFKAIRYSNDASWDDVIAPPYDVLSDDDVTTLAQRHEHNIVHIDIPRGGEDRYDKAAETLRTWLASGILVQDDTPSFYIYRMQMTDSLGNERTISGVLGGLEVVDPKDGGVLPHEKTTKKASTDRLDLTIATGANLSPVWGLSLATGLTEALADRAEPIGSLVVDGVTHSVERVTDPARIDKIRYTLAADDVLIADGHHRYGVSREYRDMIRKQTGSQDTEAEYTLAFVNELAEDQLAIDAIHRIYDGVSFEQLRQDLSACFTFESLEGEPTAQTLKEMEATGRLVLVAPGGSAEWMLPRPGAFSGVRNLDGAWLEHALAGSDATVSYQHGLDEVVRQMVSNRPAPRHSGAVLIRPTSIEEILRTAREGVLMPPKSTFFSPKLRTGLVIRPTAQYNPQAE